MQECAFDVPAETGGRAREKDRGLHGCRRGEADCRRRADIRQGRQAWKLPAAGRAFAAGGKQDAGLGWRMHRTAAAGACLATTRLARRAARREEHERLDRRKEEERQHRSGRRANASCRRAPE